MCSEEDDRKNPRPVHVTLAEDVKTGKDGQTEGMERQVSKPSPFHDHDSQKKHKPSRIYYYFYGVTAIVNLSPSICGTLMRAQPHTASAVHHHGSQDTIVYAVSGHGSLVTSSNDSDGDTRHDLKPGDWALIPAYREHQEVNDGEDEAVWVIVRAPSGVPQVENLKGWGDSRH